MLILVLFICIIIFNQIFRNDNFLSISIIIIGLLAIKRFGLMKDNNYLKPNVILVVMTTLMSFFIITYLSGLLLGFNNTIFSFKPKFLLTVIILPAGLIVFEELIRYIICSNSCGDKKPIVFYTLLMAFLNIIIEINGQDFSNKEVIFIFFSTVVLPVISRELVCSYLTYKVSYVPSLIFRLVITLYEYIFPIIPNLGNYLYSVVNVMLPYFIYLFSSKIINYKEKSKTYANKAARRVLYVPVLVVLVVLVILTSGILTHKLVSIGSNSMKPEYERGDAVIYKKQVAKDMKEGEILVFEHNDRVITHRIVKKQRVGEDYIFITKGDANNSRDNFKPTSKDVLGKVCYRIKYIGYPTLWVRGIFEGREISDNG